MNKPFALLSIAVLLTSASIVFAASSVDLTKDIPLNGSATIEVKYL